MNARLFALLPFPGRPETGRSAARPVISRFLGVSPDEIVFGEREDGEPYLVNQPETRIGLSHSGSLLLAYAGPEPIGVDIERIKPRRNLDYLMAELFQEAERDERLAEDDRLRAFYALWTGREARLKRAGLSVWDWASSMGRAAQAVPVRYWEISGPEGDYLACAAADATVLQALRLALPPGYRAQPRKYGL